ncbi:MAG: hypothetical protein AB7U82_20720 [Blastocatellales bacterium]
MDKVTRTNWDNLSSQDGETRYQAFMRLLETTKQPVDWAYEVWDELIANLSHKDNHQLAIAAHRDGIKAQLLTPRG